MKHTSNKKALRSRAHSASTYLNVNIFPNHWFYTPTGMSMSSSRFKAIDFSHSIFQATFAIHYPKAYLQRSPIDVWTYSYVFRPESWLSIAILLFIVASGFYLIKALKLEQLHEEDDSEVN